MSLKELVSTMWKIQHLQFEYPAHVKSNIIFWHFFLLVTILCTGYFISAEFRLFSILPIFSWNYYTLFDKKKRVYKDDYKIKRYEIIGTVNASLLVSALIAVFALTR